MDLAPKPPFLLSESARFMRCDGVLDKAGLSHGLPNDGANLLIRWFADEGVSASSNRPRHPLESPVYEARGHELLKPNVSPNHEYRSSPSFIRKKTERKAGFGAYGFPEIGQTRTSELISRPRKWICRRCHHQCGTILSQTWSPSPREC
jgi:hypothetical protein